MKKKANNLVSISVVTWTLNKKVIKKTAKAVMLIKKRSGKFYPPMLSSIVLYFMPVTFGVLYG